MADGSKTLKLYLISIIGIGYLFFAMMLVNLILSPIPVEGFLVFLILTIVAETLVVFLPGQGAVSVGFILYCAMIILFGAPAATVIAVLGFTFAKRKKRLSWVKMAFNQAQFAISVGVAGLVYQRFAITSFDLSLMLLVALFATVVTFFMLNTLQIALVIALSERVPVQAVIAGSMKWAIPNFFALAPMGVLLALVYQHFGVLGIILLVIPLLIARGSFQAYVDMREMYLDTIKSLTAAVDAKDPYTAGHSHRVGCYVKEIAKECKFPPEKLETLEYMAVLHDIGKVGIPEGILNKPGKLTAEEYWLMQQHSIIGYEIVGRIRRLKKNAVFIRHHHEWWDGSGYPDHLQGEEIPLESRILAVADAFDAMTMDRPYRRARTYEEAVTEVTAGAGTQFDPWVVGKFLQATPRIKEICLQKEKSRADGFFSEYLLAEAAAVREELWKVRDS